MGLFVFVLGCTCAQPGSWDEGAREAWVVPPPPWYRHSGGTTRTQKKTASEVPARGLCDLRTANCAIPALTEKRCAKFCGRVDGAASILSYIWFFRNKRATHDAVANRVVERILIPVRSPILGGGNEGSSCALAGISGRGCG